MPAYDYFCDQCGQKVTRHHSMFEGVPVICPECGCKMRKLITAMPRVNWGQIRPSDGELSPQVKALVTDTPRYRDEFEEAREAHKRRTEHEPDGNSTLHGNT